MQLLTDTRLRLLEQLGERRRGLRSLKESCTFARNILVLIVVLSKTTKQEMLYLNELTVKIIQRKAEYFFQINLYILYKWISKSNRILHHCHS